MEIQHIRNACMVIHYKDDRILVDPCLNPKGSLPPYALFRARPRLNPIIDLPVNAGSALSRITSGLITHCRYGHFDHLDKAGIRLLKAGQVPVYCNAAEEGYLRKRRLNTIPLPLIRKSPF